MGRLLKSQGEIKADALRRILKRGSANLSECALILGQSQATIRAQCDLREIAYVKIGARRYIPLEELNRLRAML